MHSDHNNLSSPILNNSTKSKLLKPVLFLASGILVGALSVLLIDRSLLQTLQRKNIADNMTWTEIEDIQEQDRVSTPNQEEESHIYTINKNQSTEFHSIEINGRTGLINPTNTHSKLHTDTSFSDPYTSLLNDSFTVFNVSDIVFASDDKAQYAVILDFLTYDNWAIYLLTQDNYTRSNQVTFITLLQELYSSFTLLDYFPSTNQILVTENGDGDSCGGTGSVILISNGTSKKISDFAVGCALDPNYEEPNPDPVYLGYMKGKLYFSEAQGVLVDGMWDGNQLTQIFTVDPRTNARTNVNVDLVSNPIESGWRSKVIDSSKFVIGYDSNENAIALDVDTLQLTTLTEEDLASTN